MREIVCVCVCVFCVFVWRVFALSGTSVDEGCCVD